MNTHVFTRDDLINFKPAHDFFVGIDSDGCVFPTMDLKQKKCFHKIIVSHWHLEKIEKYVRESAEFVNLYSIYRGRNRFPCLLMSIDLIRDRPEVVASKVKLPEFKSLRKFIDSGVPLSNAELEKADAYTSGDEQAADTGEESFYYPEWDYKRRAYRPDYSRLVEAPVTGEDAEFSARVLREKSSLIKEVTRNLEMLSPSVRLTGRQSEGTSIDLNAAIDAIADLEAGRTPDDRLYNSYVRTERDLAALFLVDLSMSTDGWAGGAKIIDHEKESLIILCEALKKLRDRYAIYGFSGKSRKGCRFYRVKGFAENYGDGVKKRIGGLIPYSYTRMGPAIRHAASILSREQARTRLLFILSDGKPNDVDVYEGRYGVEDTRKAVKEAESKGITPFCLTVDTGAGDYLPRLFGRGNYAVVPGVDMLAKKLPELYARIIHKL